MVGADIHSFGVAKRYIVQLLSWYVVGCFVIVQFAVFVALCGETLGLTTPAGLAWPQGSGCPAPAQLLYPAEPRSRSPSETCRIQRRRRQFSFG